MKTGRAWCCRFATTVSVQLFYRLAPFVMRRAVPLGLAIVTLLIAPGMPLFGMKWRVPDDRVLPTPSTARQVFDQLRSDFSADVATNVTVVIPDVGGVAPKALDAYAAQLPERSSRLAKPSRSRVSSSATTARSGAGAVPDSAVLFPSSTPRPPGFACLRKHIALRATGGRALAQNGAAIAAAAHAGSPPAATTTDMRIGIVTAWSCNGRS
jgi:hypothetical protein